MIPGPEGVDTQIVGAAPGFAQLRQRCVLRRELNADFHVRHSLILSMSLHCKHQHNGFVVALILDDRASQRSFQTSSAASITIRRDNLEAPATRSVKMMGTSVTRAPCLSARQVASMVKA